MDQDPLGFHPNPGNPGGGGAPGGNDGTQMQQFRHQQVGARVPEKVARGAFCNGVIVMRSHTEFTLDFVQRLSKPHQVAARVIVPFAVMPSFIDALKRNMEMYTQRWGAPKEPPKPPQPMMPPSFQEVYDELKISEDVMTGAYANGLLVSHSPTDFCLDFVTSFYPQSAVSARVFLNAGQLPGVIQSLAGCFEHFRKQMEEMHKAQPGRGSISSGESTSSPPPGSESTGPGPGPGYIPPPSPPTFPDFPG